MGYYTRYYLEVRGCKSKDEYNILCEALRTKDLVGYAFEPTGYIEDTRTQTFETYDSVKWYTYESDMLEISKLFPQMTFMLSGVGEDPEDIWKAYYHNGESEMCEAVVAYPKPKLIMW